MTMTMMMMTTTTTTTAAAAAMMMAGEVLFLVACVSLLVLGFSSITVKRLKPLSRNFQHRLGIWEWFCDYPVKV